MLNLVLYEPEIPQNTGNILRTCVATNTVLHLIEPLGFRMNEQSLKRSGVTYGEMAKYIIYPNFDDFLAKNQGEFYYLTRYGMKNIYDVHVEDSNKNYYFILGKESTGIPLSILQKNIDRCIRLPMNEQVRALNVSNVAAIILYEALRQQGFPGLSWLEPVTMKGPNHLLDK
ncbi:MAG: tRNA (cytidine(34)-2'-O)-methyltransferase [Bacilli bacterium]|nr:tRNA (cytidine(34)-2'-O)-methyltransferase [Bacilli bacterium]